MANLYLLNYNNYYNRKIKRENDLSGYSQYIIHQQTNVNFIPGDGISTTQVLNYRGDLYNANYLIVEASDGDNIESFTRWFVLDVIKTSTSQYKLTLRRDLIADSLTDVINAPLFVEKATLDEDDPMIFNSENMSYNQIKQSEILLKDASDCAWIVGYMARNDGSGNTTHIDGGVSLTNNQYISLVSTSKAQFIQNIQGQLLSDSPIKLTCSYNQTNNPYTIKTISYVEGQGGYFSEPEKDRHNVWACSSLPNLYNYDPIDYDGVRDIIIRSMNLKNNINDTLFYDGKKVKLSDGNTYEVSINISDDSVYIEKDIASTMPLLIELLDNNISSWLNSTGSTSNTKYGNPYGLIKYKVKTISVTLTQVSSEGLFDYTIPTTRNKVNDAPYDIFAIPYSPDKNNEPYVWLHADDQGAIGSRMNSEVGLLVAQNISEKWGATLYDLQLLPYCPLPEIFNDPGTSDMSLVELTQGVDYTLIKDSTSHVVSMILFPKESSFSTKIPLDEPIIIKEPKIESECDMYRLCSPNYQGVFEFNAAKNGGISYFNVDCTYLPYNPYIHLSPNFGKLYGKDFGDVRGIVCGGDFSLARISDAWINYQLQNKNYMASFNRQIENMEINNRIAHTQDIVKAVVGTATGAAGGAFVGNNIFAGGLGGIGAGIGGISSGLAGIADVEFNQQLRNEAIDFTRDNFGYQLGNIKALPDSLSKTTAYTKNNKYFPFLEFYTCTNEEKEALRDKLKYNGMTVMRVGNINDFLLADDTYIKGKLIRLDGDYDNHFTNELANELYKGVFIGIINAHIS